ncbi:Pseudoazurin precursor [Methyloligella halotolerans]|uniref:Pseudoazurin n=1 Tax=Methyloligella halotolerans TaxID=1177755 RepID=A0A1E2RV84_9HYPH|nr:pseudoazurin [Methyloligella halotolerans]ODA66123.1 Pseudoazurin precursor [Methyloligella halotolerans]
MISRFTTAVFAAFAMVCLSAGVASAADHKVEMLNDGGDGQYMVFKPEVLKVEVGDTVTFHPVDAGHNAQTLSEIWPEGAKDFKGEISQEVTYKVEKPGVYGVKCLPHYMMGMMMLIVAGDPENADQVESFEPPQMAKERWEKIKGEFADAK